MKNANAFLKELESGALNGRMVEIYGCDAEKAQDYADRFVRVIKGFQVTFPENAGAEIGLYSAPGRTEIGGNHTDHQYGCVLAASVNLDAIAAAALNGTNAYWPQASTWTRSLPLPSTEQIRSVSIPKATA